MKLTKYKYKRKKKNKTLRGGGIRGLARLGASAAGFC